MLLLISVLLLLISALVWYSQKAYLIAVTTVAYRAYKATDFIDEFKVDFKGVYLKMVQVFKVLGKWFLVITSPVWLPVIALGMAVLRSVCNITEV